MRRGIKNGGEPKDHEGDPQRRRYDKTADPLDMEGHTLSWKSTTLKPPREERCTTTRRATRSRFPLQKNLNTREMISALTHRGTWIREATYHTRDKARALMTKDFPRKDKARCLQEFSTFSTTVRLNEAQPWPETKPQRARRQQKGKQNSPKQAQEVDKPSTKKGWATMFKGGYTCDFNRALATRQNLKKSHHRREQKIARVAAASSPGYTL